MKELIKLESANIVPFIYLVRGEKVMVDRELAALYGVQTKVFKQAVKRNIKRFPADFMFVLSKDEFNIWRSQFVTSKSDIKGLRYSPMVFTEQGVAMLSSVLNSPRAIQVNIAIMRAFVQIRKIALTNKDLHRKINKLEKSVNAKFKNNDDKIKLIFEAIKQLLKTEIKPKNPLGFKADKI